MRVILAGSTVTAGNGRDTIAFIVTDQNVGIGNETIKNFSSRQDVIEINHTLLTGFLDLTQHAHQSGSDTVIAIDAHDTITLQGVSLSSLHASNFLFV